MSTNAVMGTNAGRRRPNRSWPEALKREIVAASLVPGVSVSIVARRYDVNANQVFKWRKSFGNDPRPPVAGQMIPVVVKAEHIGVAAEASLVGDKVEIDVAGKYRIRVSGQFDREVLRRVLDVLERR